jgi:hypothetical protein
MLVDSTTTKGNEDAKIRLSKGKKINLTIIKARIKSTIQLQIESDFHKKFHIFFSSFAISNVSQDFESQKIFYDFLDFKILMNFEWNL